MLGFAGFVFALIGGFAKWIFLMAIKAKNKKVSYQNIVWPENETPTLFNYKNGLAWFGLGFVIGILLLITYFEKKVIW